MSEFFEAPLEFPLIKVQPEWVDANDHMNVAYYVLAFDQVVDAFLNRLNMGWATMDETGSSSFTLELHVNYLHEAHVGDPLRITCQLLDHDDKRLHYFMQMHHAEAGHLVATSEQIAAHVDMNTRRTAPFTNVIAKKVGALMDSHRDLPTSKYIGRVIGIRKK